MTQQAVSRQIQKLEQELGVTLFERGPRGVKATAYADMLADKAKKILPELDAVICDIRTKDKEPAGALRLGIQCWQLGSTNPLRYDALQNFQSDFPRISLTWEICKPARCASGLLSHEFDLALMTTPKDHTGIELTPLRKLRWYMLMSARHPYANRKILYTSDLAGRRIIFPVDQTVARNRILQRLDGAEKPVFIGMNGFVFDTVAQQIDTENAMMIVPEMLRDMFNPERFTMVPMDEGYSDALVYLARPEGMPCLPAERILTRYLIERWGEKAQQ